MLCLDTSIVVDALRNRRPHLRTQLDDAERAGERVRISSIVVQELAFGAYLSARPALQLQRVGEFVSAYEVESFSAEDALSAARVRSELRIKGSEIGSMDVMIAAQALVRGWTMVTANVRDFIRVDGLDILDWSDPDEPRAFPAAARQPR